MRVFASAREWTRQKSVGAGTAVDGSSGKKVDGKSSFKGAGENAPPESAQIQGVRRKSSASAGKRVSSFLKRSPLPEIEY